MFIVLKPRISSCSIVLILRAHKQHGMLKSWLTIGVVGVLWIGCAESPSDNDTKSEAEKPKAVQRQNVGDAEGERQDVEFTVSEPEAKQSQVNLSAPAAGLNPAHGEPGHDCAIPVGAPLDGSGVQNQGANIPNATQPVLQTSAQGKAASSGINPTHGQPGHDCAVAVGAPLSVK